MFTLHPTLKKDTVFIKDLKLCQVLLMNNANYPWLILVPKKLDLVELTDLSRDDQNLLMEEIDIISKKMQNVFNPDKLNTAALGNMVPQLHIHIIARYKTDRVFPKPVWMDPEIRVYGDEEIEEVVKKLR
jgi:diadenosine tetraphosphate (Ap4A) HIT family hydrolase